MFFYNKLNFSGIYIHGARTQNNKKQLYTTSRKSAKVDPHAKEDYGLYIRVDQKDVQRFLMGVKSKESNSKKRC